MKLAIISHTEHYSDPNGYIVGWGPTITEINELAQDFDKIYHVAFYHDEDPPESSLHYTSEKIEFVPLKPSGGKNISDKLSIITTMSSNLQIIKNIIRNVDVFQFRAPVGIGVYLIPWLSLFINKKGWFKYAGNWNQKNAPVGFALQRWMLKKQKRIVTINGFWKDQPDHCLSFENPCITESEKFEGNELLKAKQYSGDLSMCFVGRLEDEKGVSRIINAFEKFKFLDRVKNIHFVGTGPKIDIYRSNAEKLRIPAKFHGALKREEVFKIYRESHFILLPSTASEGFPKVLAEAMNFGCIPICSKISSIGHYIEDGKSGFLLDMPHEETLPKALVKVLNLDNEFLNSIALKNIEIASKFTFSRYRQRIFNEIIKIR